MNWSPPCTYYFSAGDVEAEFIFLALENEDDVKKLRSLECTGIYFNEPSTSSWGSSPRPTAASAASRA
jgi:hypothetical protein